MFFQEDSITLNAHHTTGKSVKTICRSIKLVWTLPRVFRRERIGPKIIPIILHCVGAFSRLLLNECTVQSSQNFSKRNTTILYICFHINLLQVNGTLKSWVIALLPSCRDSVVPIPIASVPFSFGIQFYFLWLISILKQSYTGVCFLKLGRLALRRI